jgi:hypothetical protein
MTCQSPAGLERTPVTVDDGDGCLVAFQGAEAACADDHWSWSTLGSFSSHSSFGTSCSAAPPIPTPPHPPCSQAPEILQQDEAHCEHTLTT